MLNQTQWLKCNDEWRLIFAIITEMEGILKVER